MFKIGNFVSACEGQALSKPKFILNFQKMETNSFEKMSKEYKES